MNNKLPLISVVTIVKNDLKGIEKTINSVIGQTYKNIEYIVIDGGSTDGTVEIIKKYADKIDFWVSEPDGGIYPAMNKGAKRARGKVLNMLNSGDYYADNKVVQKVAKIFSQDKNLCFVLGRGTYYGKNGEILKGKTGEPIVTPLKAKRFSTVCHQAFFYKKELHQKFGYYDQSYRICADGLFTGKVSCSKKIKGFLVDEVFIKRQREGLSNNPRASLEQRRMYRELFGYSIVDELLLLKYFLKKNPFGKKLYSIYENMKYKLWVWLEFEYLENDIKLFEYDF